MKYISDNVSKLKGNFKRIHKYKIFQIEKNNLYLKYFLYFEPKTLVP